MTKILVIENENLVRLGIKSVLSQENDFEIVGEAETSEDGLEIFKSKRPDVTLMSLRLKETCAIDDLDRFFCV